MKKFFLTKLLFILVVTLVFSLDNSLAQTLCQGVFAELKKNTTRGPASLSKDRFQTEAVIERFNRGEIQASDLIHLEPNSPGIKLHTGNGIYLWITNGPRSQNSPDFSRIFEKYLELVGHELLERTALNAARVDDILRKSFNKANATFFIVTNGRAKNSKVLSGIGSFYSRKGYNESIPLEERPEYQRAIHRTAGQANYVELGKYVKRRLRGGADFISDHLIPLMFTFYRGGDIGFERVFVETNTSRTRLYKKIVKNLEEVDFISKEEILLTAEL